MSLKKFFFEEEEKAPAPQVAPAPPRVAVVSPQDITEFRNLFSEVLKRNNQPGMDFYEFTTILEQNQKLPVDEKTKYETTFAAFQAAGISVSNLLGSANTYLQKLSEEKASFQSAHADAQIAQVDNKDKKIADLQDENKRLNEQMNANNVKIVQLQSESSESRVKLVSKKEQFNNSYDKAVANLNQIITNIKTYLNGTT